MLLISGIDPGVSGAIGIYDFDADDLVDVWPLPNYRIMVGKTERTRLDEDELKAQFDCLRFMDVKLIGIENVQGGNFGGKKQSAAGAFQFGYTFGLLTMAARASGIQHTAASPGVWKLNERVPITATAIVKMADTEFPAHKKKWHGVKGGMMHDRAEAALLARYFARRIWPSMQPREGLRTLTKAMPALTPVRTASAWSGPMLGRRARRKTA